MSTSGGTAAYRTQGVQRVVVGRHQIRHLTRAHIVAFPFRPRCIGVPEPSVLHALKPPAGCVELGHDSTRSAGYYGVHGCAATHSLHKTNACSPPYQLGCLVSVIVVQGKVQHDGCIAGRHANMWTLQLRRKCRLEARQRGSVANGSGCGHHEAPSQRAVRCKHGRCMRAGKHDECEQGPAASRGDDRRQPRKTVAPH